MNHPARYPDVYVYPHDYDTSDGVAWDLTIKTGGVPVDLSAVALFAPVYDDGELKGSLILGRDNDADGVVQLELPQDLFAQLGAFSTWYLREGTIFNQTLMTGRIVKDL